MNTTPRNTTNGETITVDLAEKTYGVAGHNLRRWLRDNKIEGLKEGRKYLIDVKSLERFLADHGKQGQSPEPAAANGHDVPAPASAPEAGKPDTKVDLHGPAMGADTQPDDATASDTPKQPGHRNRGKGRSRKGRSGHPKPAGHRRYGVKLDHAALRHAKNGMRKFGLHELHDLRTWIMHRMDQRTKLA